jgi:hypothetical protein
VALKLKILLAITGLLVGGLWLFSSGSDTRETAKKADNSLSQKQSGVPTVTSKKTITTPFTEPVIDTESPSSLESRSTSTSHFEEKVSLSAASDTQQPKTQTPLQLIDAYMTAWSGNSRSEVNALWKEISQCPECLQRIKELLMNQGVPKGMLLELTYQIIELGNETMLPVFDYLLQPAVDLNSRIIITQQMIKDGRGMYVKKLFDILQQADIDGYQDYAAKHAWMISKLKNPQGIAAIFDVMSGRSGSSQRFADHVRNVFNNTLVGTKQHSAMTDAMVDYYLSADGTEQENLWGVISMHSESLGALAKSAYENGNLNQFKKYSQSLAGINSVAAVEGTLELVGKVDYSQEYFIEMISTLTRRFNHLETLRKLEDYLRNPHADSRTRIVAAEGLLAVKESEQARFILEKALKSNSYEDSEIVAYISARL